MSFILDALRKSENERQRSAVPRVTRAPLARPRAQPPVWTVVVIAALTGCVIVLGAAWWITVSSPSQTAPEAIPRTEGPADTPVARTEPSAAPADAASETRGPEASPATTTQAAPPRTAPLDSLAITPAPVTTPAVTASPSPSQQGTADTASPDRAAASLTRAPTRTELVADGINVPDVRVELHAYDTNAARRFAFINGQRVVEGDSLREGPRIVSIDPDSVTLSYGGTRFRLTPQ